MDRIGIRADATAADPVSDGPRWSHALNHSARARPWLHLLELLLIRGCQRDRLDAVPKLRLLFFDTRFAAIFSTAYAAVFL